MHLLDEAETKIREAKEILRSREDLSERERALLAQLTLIAENLDTVNSRLG